MYIDITVFVTNSDPFEFSASRAERGDNAGPETWMNAKSEASVRPLIGEDARDTFERWAREFGAWDDDEIAAWTLEECNALLIQYISGDLRQLEHNDDGEIDWAATEDKLDGGNSILQGDNGRIYFYMGS